ncbi:hypothetical protein C8F04DRAFT_1061638 [Mycena alexandri]|uniref:Ribosomal protein S21 n=1 Tax=Mycena alexandri TaxID=1745969 RepID=A0AAD6TJJ8_9AGAR|nr:hypothetical protein C8F04DRAFT_1061638 [Mycena alexandri]
MFPALTRLLARAPCRCFSSRSAILNTLPPSYHPRPPLRSFKIDIKPDIPNIPQERDPNNSWNNSVGDVATQPLPGEEISAEDRWRVHSARTIPVLQRVRIPDAYTGRSVRVNSGKFAEAVREFERVLRTNTVRHTWVSTARHEKKGPKRRRIRSEQWRKHFAHQVRKNVQLVHKIRRRGV